MDDPEQHARFKIEGPDHDGFVWLCSPAGRDDWCRNLGPVDEVAKTLSHWLAASGHHERRSSDKVNVNNPEDVQRWCAELQCSQAQLQTVVRQVGTSAAAVRRQFASMWSGNGI